jgi:hypothetical protein
MSTRFPQAAVLLSLFGEFAAVAIAAGGVANIAISVGILAQIRIRHLAYYRRETSAVNIQNYVEGQKPMGTAFVFRHLFSYLRRT